MKCKICSEESLLFARSTIMHKHSIAYFKCGHCGFVQTEDPYWLQEAYASPINRSDVGLVDRNIRLAKIARSVISGFFNADAKFIDYGGGYGLFVRLMRDYGFDFYRYDKFCDNLFAQGFDGEVSERHHYELLTAFEVFEHLGAPTDEIDRMVKLSDNILFTTELLPVDYPKPGDWPYYGLDHGQHISFYSLKTLNFIAKRSRLNLYTDGAMLHLMTIKKLSSLPLKYLSLKMKLLDFLRSFVGRKSLIQSDHGIMMGKQRF